MKPDISDIFDWFKEAHPEVPMDISPWGVMEINPPGRHDLWVELLEDGRFGLARKNYYGEPDEIYDTAEEIKHSIEARLK